MTVQEMMVEVFEGSGEPTDLDIYDSGGTFDITTAGSVRVLSFLNRAYQRLSNWKMPNGTNVRFASMNRRKIFKAQTFTLAVDSSATSTTTVVYLDSTASSVDNHYVEWTMYVNSQRKVITAYDGTTRAATLHSALSAAPAAADAVVLEKRFFQFVADDSSYHPGEVIEVDPREVVAVQSIFDLTSGIGLQRMSRTDEFWSQMTQGTGAPGSFSQIDDGIEFDVPPTTGEVFLMRYYGQPESLTGATQVPKIPVAWHEPLVYLAIWITMKRDRATDEAYSLKRDIQDMIAQTVQQSERSFEFEDGGLYVKE